MPWAPYSPDLTPLDYMLWGYLKSKVYINKPDSIQSLKAAIKNEMQLPVTIIDSIIEDLPNTRLPAVIVTSNTLDKLSAGFLLTYN